jgi:hypothetical protein
MDSARSPNPASVMQRRHNRTDDASPMRQNESSRRCTLRPIGPFERTPKTHHFIDGIDVAACSIRCPSHRCASCAHVRAYARHCVATIRARVGCCERGPPVLDGHSTHTPPPRQSVCALTMTSLVDSTRKACAVAPRNRIHNETSLPAHCFSASRRSVSVTASCDASAVYDVSMRSRNVRLVMLCIVVVE